jgi:hypothetical protein
MDSFDTQQQCEECFIEADFLGAFAESEADLLYPYTFGLEYWLRID